MSAVKLHKINSPNLTFYMLLYRFNMLSKDRNHEINQNYYITLTAIVLFIFWFLHLISASLIVVTLNRKIIFSRQYYTHIYNIFVQHKWEYSYVHILAIGSLAKTSHSGFCGIKCWLTRSTDTVVAYFELH